MTTGYSTTLRNAQLDQITTAVGSAGTLKIYDGTGGRPATGGSITTQVLLATFTLGSPFGPASSGGVLSPTLPANVTAAATGTAAWFRIASSGGTFCIDGSVGTSSSDLNLNSTAISSGATVSITSWSITRGNP